LPGIFLFEGRSQVKYASDASFKLNVFLNWTHITIGNKNDDENMRPTIGDNVYIGAGAIIIGDIVIGNSVTIGAGAVVVKNVSDGAIIVGNPGRVIKTN